MILVSGMPVLNESKYSLEISPNGPSGPNSLTSAGSESGYFMSLEIKYGSLVALFSKNPPPIGLPNQSQ